MSDALLFQHRSLPLQSPAKNSSTLAKNPQKTAGAKAPTGFFIFNTGGRIRGREKRVYPH
tara:strand:- start:921 stop:1100 length:180 start_codon:yes stop_codon:yes gene_type:complete